MVKWMRVLLLKGFKNLFRKKTIFFLIVVFIIGVISNFPAKIFVRHVLSESLTINGISGSIWNGSASEASYDKLFIRDMRWSIEPMSLFAGKLSYEISLYPFNGKIEASASTNFSRAITFNNVKGMLSEGTLSELFPYFSIDGEINFAIKSLILKNNLPVMLNGDIKIINLRINGLSDQPIGNYLLKFDPTNDAIIGSIEGANALIDVAGVIILNTDGAYEVSGVVAANQFTPEKITMLLGLLGTPNNLGQRDFRFEGKL